jgi:hypothetical protein
MATSKGPIIIAALAGIGLLFAGAAAANASEDKGGGGGGGGGDEPDRGGDLPPGLCEMDADLPPALKQQVLQSISATAGLAPLDYENLAAVLEAGGYPKAAACVRKRGKEVRTAQETTIATRGGLPHVVRTGDIPYLMAKYYTGVPGRFRELKDLNPQMGPLRTIDGVSNYQNWAPGLEILIPKSWNPLAKPVPAPATGGAPKSAQSAIDAAKAQSGQTQASGPSWLDKVTGAVKDAAAQAAIDAVTKSPGETSA